MAYYRIKKNGPKQYLHTRFAKYPLILNVAQNFIWVKNSEIK